MTERGPAEVVPLHPALSQVLDWFDVSHLDQELQDVVKPLGKYARAAAERSPNSPETTVGLRKLLEAKDAFVRAAIAARRAP